MKTFGFLIITFIISFNALIERDYSPDKDTIVFIKPDHVDLNFEIKSTCLF